MTASVGNWIVENCGTVGEGNIVLSGSEASFARFRDAIDAGPVWYAIQDSNGNRESGIGTFDGATTLVRSDVHATLISGVYKDTNPTPISLSGVASVACTFNANSYREFEEHLTNTSNPHTVNAGQIPYDSSSDPVTDEVLLQGAMIDHAYSIEERVPAANGIISGGVISGVVGASSFDISAGSGIIYDAYTDPINTSVTSITWVPVDNETIQVNGMSAGTIRIFMASSGSVIQVTGSPALSLWRDYIMLGAVYFVEGLITEVVNSPVVIKQTSTDTNDLLVHDIRVSDLGLEPVTDELQVWATSGSIFYPGINWYADHKSPNIAEIPQKGDSVTPIEFHAITQTGLLSGPHTTIPTQYNPTGDTLTALHGNDATIHRMYSIGVGAGRSFILLYGQYAYADAQTAKDNLRVDNDLTVFPMEATAAYILAYVGVEGNAPDFNDINDAWIISPEGGSGSSTSASQDHTALSNRDAANQHPISAITDLEYWLEHIDNINLEINTNTVVDVSIYDTSLDDDGGEWVGGAISGSWYEESLNTAIRGPVAMFPKLALIVAEANKVTLYDATLPDCDMWMVFDSIGSLITSVVMLNGILYVGSDTESVKFEFNFLKDSIFTRYNSAAANGISPTNIAGRQNILNGSGDENYIISWYVNQIAVTSDGLGNNITYYATDGGLSRIGPDGKVSSWVDTSGSNVNFIHRVAVAGGLVYWDCNTAPGGGFYVLSEGCYTSLVPSSFGAALHYTLASSASWASTQIVLSSGGISGRVQALRGGDVPSNQYLCRLYPNSVNWGQSMVAIITNAFTSGVMHGDIRGAYLANSKFADRCYKYEEIEEAGTVTESPVAPGAELLGYSGFTTTDYLFQNENSALDLGTGDFTVMAHMVPPTGVNYRTVFDRNDVGSVGPQFLFDTGLDYDPRLVVGAVVVDSGIALKTTQWSMVSFVRRDGKVTAYVNDVQGSTKLAAANITNLSAILNIGRRVDGTSPLAGGSLALVRISGSPATFDQIKTIYRHENQLFKEDQKCLMQGAHLQCVASDYDEEKDVLTVCSNSHVTQFQGLVVVDDWAEVATSASAVNNKLVTGV